MNYFPMFLNLQGKQCVFVGGGRVAERKIAALIPTEAEICVISLTATDRINEWSKQERLRWLKREFQPSDVTEATVVIAATDQPHINLQVYQCMEKHQWVNIVDRPDLSTFIFPSTVRRGDLCIAISTKGNFPKLSKQLRTELEKWIGDDYAEYTCFLGKSRTMILGLTMSEEQRGELLNELLDERFLLLTRRGDYEKREHELIRLIEIYQKEKK